MALFRTQMDLRDGLSVLDLGGQPMIWDSIPERLKITILNLPGVAKSTHRSHHQIKYIEGDACNVTTHADQSFDIVFSNSVIEHVGGEASRRRFAQEVQRLGWAYWVQTPSAYFPIEAHTGMPLWWAYPNALRQFILRRWALKLPGWTDMVKNTTYVTRREMQALFPAATLKVERLAGFPKSYILFSARRAR